MKKTIEDYDLGGKRVIIRVDFNVPIQDGVIQDDTRIRASLKTICYAIDKGARVILFSHLGKIKDVSDLEKNNMFPVSVRLQELLHHDVVFSSVTRGVDLEEKVASLKDGDVLLVQNTRYEDLDYNKESGCDEDLSRYWASLGDIFINDAYGTCHRAHASNVGIAKLLPNGIGFLVRDEVEKLDAIMNEESRPFVVMMGGAKVHDKMKVIENLGKICDKLLIGGGMAYTFLKANGLEVGHSLVDEEGLDFCRTMLSQYSSKIVLPVDHVVATSLEDKNVKTVKIEDTSFDEMGFDIGEETIFLFESYLKQAKRVIINGPMGMFENSLYQNGTKKIYDFIVSHHIKTLVGGGDSAASVHLLSDEEEFYHISTGGGATLEYLEGKVLPGIEVINEK